MDESKINELADRFHAYNLSEVKKEHAEYKYHSTSNLIEISLLPDPFDSESKREEYWMSPDQFKSIGEIFLTLIPDTSIEQRTTNNEQQS